MNNKRLMVIAGGTGGHVFPGIVIANQIMEQGWQVRWIGTIDHIESHLVPKYGIDIDFIRISSIRGKNIIGLFSGLCSVFSAWCQAKSIIKDWKPDVVLGMGGYVSAPSALAAWTCKVPLIIHEQNRIAGLTNKLLSMIAAKVMQAFPGAFPKGEVVGNPIRADILTIPLPADRMRNRIGPIRILVIGGSQGAHILNHILPQVASDLGNKITIWHQTGKNSKYTVQKAYDILGYSQCIVTEFIKDMVEAYSWADLVICRSGALTVSEVSAVGIAAIFVPYQHKDNQQYWNALPLEKNGAAKIIKQQCFTASKLSSTLRKLDHDTLLKMANKARQLAYPKSTEKIIQIIENVLNCK